MTNALTRHRMIAGAVAAVISARLAQPAGARSWSATGQGGRTVSRTVTPTNNGGGSFGRTTSTTGPNGNTVTRQATQTNNGNGTYTDARTVTGPNGQAHTNSYTRQ
jgi:hypothetical protein